MYDKIIDFIREEQGGAKIIPLHEPRFTGDEIGVLRDCIESGFVSSVGEYVEKFEKAIAKFCGAKFAVATVNGTAALHTALKIAGVEPKDEVLTQSLTFVATANAISYTGASPVFIDVDKDSLGLSPEKLENFLRKDSKLKKDGTFNKRTGRRIRACVPMHTFGHPCRIDEIAGICRKYKIIMIEDAAESLGSLYRNKHTGTFGKAGILSFNGNKIITTGGGGMIITNDAIFAKRAKHITTTAKLPHKWDYIHDEIGYNYRLPNINSAIGYAQVKKLKGFLAKKRLLAERYAKFFKSAGIPFISEPKNACSNYWLNSILFENRSKRNSFLEFAHSRGILVRPAWRLMSELDMFKSYQCGNLENTKWLEERIVNLPSSVPK
ncbi:MAG TPA: LegC family aminotransferase [Victivallales bacterium]|nr:LegC family aminotransferase [Victivallales bacterium]